MKAWSFSADDRVADLEGIVELHCLLTSMLHESAVRDTGYQPNCIILIIVLYCRHIAGKRKPFGDQRLLQWDDVPIDEAALLLPTLLSIQGSHAPAPYCLPDFELKTWLLGRHMPHALDNLLRCGPRRVVTALTFDLQA